MQRLMLQLRETTSSDHLLASWWFFDGQQLANQGNATSPEDMASTWLSLKEQATSTIEVVLFAPAHRVHMRHLSVTKAQRRYLGRVLPYLMEPYLGQSVDDMHFVSAPAQAETVWAFAVSHAQMVSWQTWSALFGDYRVSLLALPSVLSTSSTEAISELLGECFQYQQGQWCWLPKSLAPQQVASVQDSISINQVLMQSKAWQKSNLLQGRYQARVKRSSSSHPWALAAALSLFAFSSYSLNTYLDTQSLNQQAKQLESSANQAFLQLVPEEGRVVNLSRQMAARLQQVSKAPSQQYASAYEVLALLDSVTGDSAKEQGLQSIAWREQSYRFEWRASSRSELERIQQALSNKGIELEQTVRQEQGYLGVFRAIGALL